MTTPTGNLLDSYPALDPTSIYRQIDLDNLVRAYNDLHPEAAFMLHGFGHREVESKRSYQKGAPDALFQSRLYDKIGGSPALDHSWVNVRKI